ncbi:MAG TPA: hypothetical protein IAB62_09915 [Candidatus Coprocola pullicola]|nr:hypothetical protein [Candidatus Coprocola pullicola]
MTEFVINNRRYFRKSKKHCTHHIKRKSKGYNTSLGNGTVLKKSQKIVFEYGKSKADNSSMILKNIVTQNMVL